MSKNQDRVVMYFGSYSSLADARTDFEDIKELKSEKLIGDYESALFERNAEGEVKVIETDATERAWGAKAGGITGAVIGLIFPPSLLVAGAVGAGAGAFAGNLMRGLKRKDIKEIGEMLDEGQAGVVLVGFTAIEEGSNRLMTRAAKIMKQDVDTPPEELKAQTDEAVE